MRPLKKSGQENSFREEAAQAIEDFPKNQQRSIAQSGQGIT